MGQPSVAADGRNVGADDERVIPVAAQAPAEPRDVVVGVDRPDQSEDMARELTLGGGDGRVDRVVAVRVDQRIDVAGVVGPGRGDQLTAGSRVGLVSAGKVAVDQVVHDAHPFGG